MFVVLFIFGEYPVTEPNRIIAGVEVLMTLGIGILGIICMVNYLSKRTH
jgi:multisubunit Na+/H+ antiporter MnhB subunit